MVVLHYGQSRRPGYHDFIICDLVAGRLHALQQVAVSQFYEIVGITTLTIPLHLPLQLPLHFCKSFLSHSYFIHCHPEPCQQFLQAMTYNLLTCPILSPTSQLSPMHLKTSL